MGVGAIMNVACNMCGKVTPVEKQPVWRAWMGFCSQGCADAHEVAETLEGKGDGKCEVCKCSVPHGTKRCRLCARRKSPS